MNTSTNLEKCMTYLEKVPPAISGSYGDKSTYRAALACKRFGLTQSEIWQAMCWFNDNRCQPPWSEKDLRHKISGVLDLSIKRPLGERQNFKSARRVKVFVAPPVAEKPADTRPICQRSEQEEELFWARVAVELGTTLAQFDEACQVGVSER